MPERRSTPPEQPSEGPFVTAPEPSLFDPTTGRGPVLAVVAWLTDKGTADAEIAYRPARVLMQDFTGVPAVVDLAAMRDAMVNLGKSA